MAGPARAEAFAYGAVDHLPVADISITYVDIVKKRTASSVRNVPQGKNINDRLIGEANDAQSTSVGLSAYVILTEDQIESIQYAVAMPPKKRHLSVNRLDLFQKVGPNLWEFNDENGVFVVDDQKGLIHLSQDRDGSRVDSFSIHMDNVVQIVGYGRDADLWRNPTMPWEQKQLSVTESTNGKGPFDMPREPEREVFHQE